MKITPGFGKISGNPEAIGICLFDDEIRSGKFSAISAATKRAMERIIAASKFSGKPTETIAHLSESASAPVLVLQGMGSRKEFNWLRLRLAAGAVARAARDAGAKSLALVSGDKLTEDLSEEMITRALVDGLILGTWTFDHYKAQKDKRLLRETVIYYGSEERKKAASKMIRHARILAEGQCVARDLTTHPTNEVNTDYLVREAKALSKKGIKTTVLEAAQMKKLGMNLILAVGQASAMPPRLIIMDYKPARARKTVALIGKGVVFDSGGLNIKTLMMDEMKSDMGGAAAVMGAMHTIARLKPGIRVIGVIGTVENAIGPNAYRPSDIYTAYNGKTVEVMNTDAEGRLVLADALAYTIDKYQPNAVIDLATLTGAAKVALGKYADAVFSNSDRMKKAVLAAAELAGERMWPMPLFEEYTKEVEGETAQLRNSVGHRWGGACTAAAFLKEFVGNTSWTHIDIAPTAFPGAPSSIQPKMTATGSGVKTIVEWALNF
ncbi:leucyl aminopeptidase [bacterium]|nr:leucyl aminopeptidase [bacterium]MBU1636933.1 leucyl aminopeptidase [bacterium]